MNILFLDDDLLRCRNFQARFPSAIIVHTAEDCIAALKQATETWDDVHLDHDLGDEVYVDSSLPNTGYEVVRYIQANKPKINFVTVHSYNSSAAVNMVKDLKRAGYSARYYPFKHVAL